ncbi:hypothetical protein EAG_07427 [Camponotus floridanus]|uniref:Uncharacterized protein n=1 Tax=Camponotus floridanus TaxID=104421 RepID=E2ASI3_CAMFO|nr:hypothetical protein EAG_07427 [Camponotus floridanus]
MAVWVLDQAEKARMLRGKQRAGSHKRERSREISVEREGLPIEGSHRASRWAPCTRAAALSSPRRALRREGRGKDRFAGTARSLAPFRFCNDRRGPTRETLARNRLRKSRRNILGTNHANDLRNVNVEEPICHVRLQQSEQCERIMNQWILRIEDQESIELYNRMADVAVFDDEIEWSNVDWLSLNAIDKDRE